MFQGDAPHEALAAQEDAHESDVALRPHPPE
jgi:hypothetical protein